MFECAFGGAAENGGSPCDGTFARTALAVIGARHACIEVDLVVSGEHARADQFTRIAHRHGRRLFSPRVRTKMVSAQQHSLPRKSNSLRCGVDKLGELRRSLSGVTAQLIHLTRSRFDVQNGFILDGLLDGCRDDTGVSGADGVHAYFFAAAIATDDLL